MIFLFCTYMENGEYKQSKLANLRMSMSMSMQPTKMHIDFQSEDSRHQCHIITANEKDESLTHGS